VKEAASRYFCWGEARAWVYQTSWGTAICICDKRATIPDFAALIPDSGGGIGNFKNLEGGDRKFTNIPKRSPVKIWTFFKTSPFLPPPPPQHNKCTFP
jgi:hypothetical protein